MYFSDERWKIIALTFTRFIQKAAAPMPPAAATAEAATCHYRAGRYRLASDAFAAAADGGEGEGAEGEGGDGFETGEDGSAQQSNSASAYAGGSSSGWGSGGGSYECDSGHGKVSAGNILRLGGLGRGRGASGPRPRGLVSDVTQPTTMSNF